MTDLEWQNLTVLVVEDEVDLRETLVMLFSMKTNQVFQAGDGRQALDLLQKQKVDLIFSDIKMPVCDGVEMLKEVRARDPKLPVVFLATGFADIDAEEAKKRGAAGLLRKPFTIQDLFAAVESALANAGQKTGAA